jgi:DNA-directed RNA polymerase, mitochondrial
MRFKENTEQQSYLKEASDRGQLEYVFAGLDVLSATPWAINRSVFDVVLKIWNDGDAIADIPASEAKANYHRPQKPTSDDPDPHARTKYVLEVKELSRQMWKDHAERCKFNYNLEIARSVSWPGFRKS